MKLLVLLGVGILLHIVWFFAVFEIYLTTPLVGGMDSYKSPLPAPAKRLVFIIADGLKADKVLELLPDGKTPAPYIRLVPVIFIYTLSLSLYLSTLYIFLSLPYSQLSIFCCQPLSLSLFLSISPHLFTSSLHKSFTFWLYITC